jgi:hypothetical protein
VVAGSDGHPGTGPHQQQAAHPVPPEAEERIGGDALRVRGSPQGALPPGAVHQATSSPLSPNDTTTPKVPIPCGWMASTLHKPLNRSSHMLSHQGCTTPRGDGEMSATLSKIRGRSPKFGPNNSRELLLFHGEGLLTLSVNPKGPD